MAIPAALWWALIVGSAAWLRWSSMPAEVAFSDLAHTWFDLRVAVATMFAALQMMIAYVLIGALMLEDVVGGSRSFWLTRPIGGRRLLGGKAMAAILLFVVAPILVLVPIWIVARWSPEELMHGTLVTAMWQSVLLGGGLSVGTLTRNLGQYFLATLVLIVAALTGLFVGTGQHGTVIILNGIYDWMVIVGCLLAAVVFVAWQYSTRRMALGWTVMVIGLVAGILVLRERWGHGVGEWASQSAVNRVAGRPVEIGRIEGRRDDVRMELRTVVTRSDGPLVVPVRAWATLRAENRTVGRIDVKLTDRWDEIVGQHVLLQHAADNATVTWEMNGRWLEDRSSAITETPVECDGEVVTATLRMHIIGELPLHVGATARDGATQVRIAGVTDEQDGKVSVLLEEHGCGSTAEITVLPRAYPNTPPSTIAGYIAVDRIKQRLARVALRNRGSVVLDEIGVGITDLVIAPPTNDSADDWQRGVTLIVVRLKSERYERHPLAGRDIRLVEEGNR